MNYYNVKENKFCNKKNRNYLEFKEKNNKIGKIFKKTILNSMNRIKKI